MITRTSPDIDAITQDVYEHFGFAQTVAASETRYFAGLAPVRGDLSTFHLVGEGDMTAQLVECLRQLDALLAAEGLERRHVVSWTFYTTDMNALVPLMPTVVSDWVGEHAPANSMVTVSGFVTAGQLIEITPIAVGPVLKGRA